MNIIPLDEIGLFEIIYADPPWHYNIGQQHNGKGGKATGGASKHYSTMTLEELKQLSVSNIAAKNSLLFLWSSSPHLDEAIDLGKSWGFNWATVAFVWDKLKVNPGYYTMSQCELCLLFKRGKIPSPRGARNVRQLITAKRGEHSVKPAEAKERINIMFPEQSKIELFAREQFDSGWVHWGLEVNGRLENK